MRLLCVLALSLKAMWGFAVETDNRPLTVKVAAVQCSSDLGEVEGNRQKLTKLAEEAAQNGAKIIVFPEVAITGYLSQDQKVNWQVKGWPIEKIYTGKDPLPYAETVPGTSTRHFCALAKKLGVYITVPLVEVEAGKDGQPAKDPKFFNTVCLVAPSGEIVAHYRKVAPWPFAEKSWATPGNLGLVTCKTEYGVIGFGICFDIHTVVAKYQPHHIWALLHPTAWADSEHPVEWFYHHLPERVKTFDHYVICANWSVDKKQAWRGYGFSEIISPKGEVLAAAKSVYGSEIIYAEIKTEALAKKE